MLTMAGSACILLGGMLLRQSILRERRLRRTALDELLMTLRRMRDEIRIARTPIPALIASAGNQRSVVGNLFVRMEEKLRSGASLQKAWEEAAEVFPLTEAAGSAFLELGQMLSGDEEAVTSALTLAIHRLDQEREALEQNRTQEARQITAASLSASALLLILFL